jgi:2-amino-4-hydroxy-6-hydroxymethyldihydropteridine diphosphokinase/dihydropteroate synthase
MAIYLSLGSNLGRRRDNLRAALAALTGESVRVLRVSPVVESPALLPAYAPSDWNSPFLNLVAKCESSLDPAQLLAALKRIEQQLGRDDKRHWAPRPIDIDILLIGDQVTQTPELTIPHAALIERAFVLTPLVSLDPGLIIPDTSAGNEPRTALEASRALGRSIPLWMGIVNLTPDSFSDGGRTEVWTDVERRIDQMIDSGVHIVDFGAESTRPGAIPLPPSGEWSRLAPILEHTSEKFAGDTLSPSISVDTYHPEVAEKALKAGVDIINDVAGLTDPAMIALAARSDAVFVAMHNLGLPADPARTLDPGSSAVDQVEEWLDRQMELWRHEDIDLARIVFDPGIGFGKNPLQSLELLREIGRFTNKGLRVLVGHSRKSFLQRLAGDSVEQRDLATIGSSLALCAHGVDILRVHNVPDHVAAYRGWSHMERPG